MKDDEIKGKDREETLSESKKNNENVRLAIGHARSRLLRSDGYDRSTRSR